MLLYPNQENWVGYFLQESSTPEKAFESIWDNFLMIKHQNWVYFRLKPGCKIFKSLPTKAYNPGLNYGDMVSIYPDAELDFAWSSDGKNTGIPKKSETYSYEVKADYTPIYLELKPDTDITEVAVFCDSLCKGRSLVQDGSAMIRAYLTFSFREGGKNLMFELLHKNGEREVVSQYYVYEKSVKTMLKRTINTEEQRNLYCISLRERGNSKIAPGQKIELNINTTNKKTESDIITVQVEFILPETEDAKVEIFNIKGQKIKTLFDGVAHSGKNLLVWNGIDDVNQAVGSGIYFSRITTAHEETSKKLMLLK